MCILLRSESIGAMWRSAILGRALVCTNTRLAAQSWSSLRAPLEYLKPKCQIIRQYSTPSSASIGNFLNRSSNAPFFSQIRSLSPWSVRLSNVKVLLQELRAGGKLAGPARLPNIAAPARLVTVPLMVIASQFLARKSGCAIVSR